MPPPKKPKKGPTSADQFLSAEELTKLRSQRHPSSASESSDTGRNSTPPINTEDASSEKNSRPQSENNVSNYLPNNNGDLPINLSSSVEDRLPGEITGSVLVQQSRTYSTSSYSETDSQGSRNVNYGDPEPPVLQRMTDHVSSNPVVSNRHMPSPSRGSTSSPSIGHALTNSPLLFQRHQSPMLTFMMAVPSSHALWQPSIPEHLSHQHAAGFPPITSLENKNHPHLYSHPQDFSKKNSNGGGRKRRPRYSLLSAALSNSVTSTSTSNHNTTVSTSLPQGHIQSREQHRKHAFDLLSVPASTTALLQLASASRTDLVHNSGHLITSAGQHTNPALIQTSSNLHHINDSLRTSHGNHTSHSPFSDANISNFPLYSHVSNVDNKSAILQTARNGNHSNGNGGSVSALLNLPPTSVGGSSASPRDRLTIEGFVAGVASPTVRGEERLSALTPDSPVFRNPSDSAILHDVPRLSSENVLQHTGSTSSSQSLQLDETKDGSVSETSRRDSSREGEEEGVVSPMQSPISSTSLSGPPSSVASLQPTVCSTSCLLPEERAHLNGSTSSIDMEAGSSSHHAMDFGDPLKIKQEEQLPGSSSGNNVSRQCQVCNDGASGFHYGVWSCEGCKAFFKRSIQGPVDYICPATNNCTIDKHRRKSCQACRLRKCYEVGMTKGTSQRKERRSSSSSNVGTPVSRPRKRQRADGTIVTNGTKAKRMSHMVVLVLDALIQADTPILESFHDHSLPPSKIHLLSSLLKLVDRELVYLINWAKHVQGYTDLVLCDQVHLIECCWMELLLLSCAFRSIEYQGKQLVFASDLILDRQVWHMLDMADVLEQVAAISAQMALYGINKEELLLLKALSLTNAEVRQLSNPGLLSNMRNNLIEALTATAQKHHPQNWGYVPSLMLLLAHIRQASLQTIGHLQKLKNEGAVPFCDLLKEMLEAQSLPSEEKSALNQCG